MDANPLVRILKKDRSQFTRQDIMKIIKTQDVRSIHFRYPAKDGKLKELKLPVNNLQDVEAILAEGERVDGSSLFKGSIDTGHSDLYVVPMYDTAFFNPFVPGCLEFLCRYIDDEGNPAAITPDNILARSDEIFKKETGMELQALGELEFYIIYPDEENLYPGKPQGFYHESSPFVKWGDLTEEILRLTSEICGNVKYCHSEVGYIQPSEKDIPEIRGKRMTQYELEFLPAPLLDMAGRLITAKWLIRNLAAERGVLVSFAPKLSIGDAGSGLHFHLTLLKNGKNMLTDKKGELTSTALAAIGGLLKLSGSLSAFGNTCAASYLRLVPHQEAPVKVCWSASNRSALVRVPLAWRGVNNLASRVNPQQPADFKGQMFGQTFELRSPDGSADIYLLLAGIAVAVREGLANAKKFEALAKELNVTKNIFHDKNIADALESLPASCWESAQALKKDRAYYEDKNIFPEIVLDFCTRRLENENDRNLSSELKKMSETKQLQTLRNIMFASLHCM